MGLNPDPQIPGTGSIRISRQGFQVEIHPHAHSVVGLPIELMPEIIERLIREHQRMISASARTVLKNAPESAVTLVALEGLPEMCVKEFRWRGYVHAAKGIVRPTQGRRTFVNGWLLNQHSVNAAYPLALVRDVRAGVVCVEWVVMESVSNSLPLDRYILRRVSMAWNREEKRELDRSLGRFVAKMHAQGIFHSDLKTCNILVSEAVSEIHAPHDRKNATTLPGLATRFILVDYDDVTFSAEVARRRRVKNLVQIFLSTPRIITLTDRLRFLNEYGPHAGITATEKRLIAHEVLQAVQGKTILYVGFHGDIRENAFPN